MSDLTNRAQMESILSDVYPKGDVRADVVDLFDKWFIRIHGSVDGRSPKYAVERRSQLVTHLGRWAARNGFDIEVDIQLDDAVRRLEEALQSLLRSSFGNCILKTTVDLKTTGATHITIFVSASRPILEKKAYQAVNSLVESFNLSLKSMGIMYDRPRVYLSDMQVLAAVKRRQPVAVSELVEGCREMASCNEVNMADIRRVCDRLRHRGLVRYESSSKRYVLTFQGLAAIPGAARSRSTDVARALELGRRRW